MDCLGPRAVGKTSRILVTNCVQGKFFLNLEPAPAATPHLPVCPRPGPDGQPVERSHPGQGAAQLGHHLVDGLDDTEIVAELQTPDRLAADTAYGSSPNLSWLVEEKGIDPHIPV